MQIADLVINDATPTAQTFSAAIPASGTNPAKWVDLASSSYPGHRRYLLVSARPGGTPATRNVECTYVHPFPETIDSREVVTHTAILRVRAVVPQFVNSDDLEDMAALFGNAMAAPLTQQIVREASAPI